VWDRIAEFRQSLVHLTTVAFRPRTCCKNDTDEKWNRQIIRNYFIRKNTSVIGGRLDVYGVHIAQLFIVSQAGVFDFSCWWYKRLGVYICVRAVCFAWGWLNTTIRTPIGFTRSRISRENNKTHVLRACVYRRFGGIRFVYFVFLFASISPVIAIDLMSSAHFVRVWFGIIIKKKKQS